MAKLFDDNGMSVAASLLRALAPLSSVDTVDVAAVMRALRRDRLDALPLPGRGDTLERWRALAAVAAADLSLAKAYEGHTDALAILAELHGGVLPPAGLGAVWAAEMPQAQVHFEAEPGRPDTTASGGAVTRAGTLTGTKAWCSGADFVDFALLTATTAAGDRILVQVDMRAPGITRSTNTWKAVGMAAAVSGHVHFDNTPVLQIGAPQAYLTRPGFWHGGVGVAACWFGGCEALAAALWQRVRRERERPDPHRLAHLGAVDVALRQLRAFFHEAARDIDADPRADRFTMALRLRGATEEAACRVLEHANRALGPGMLCEDRHYARLAADLPVFIRQCHAQQDLAALGHAIGQAETLWQL